MDRTMAMAVDTAVDMVVDMAVDRSTARSHRVMGKVRLIASDGHEFVVDKKIAFLSQTLKMFFNTEFLFKEAQNGSVLLPIQSDILNRIIEFMEHKHRSLNNIATSEFKVHDEETNALLDVASYLRI